MRSRKLARRYALALGELAQERGALADVESDMVALRDLLKSERSLQRVMERENVSAEEKSALVRALFAERFNAITLNFLLLVISKRREAALPEMIEEFLAYADGQRGVVQVDLATARPLSKDDSGAIAGRLSQVLGKDVRLTVREDPDLIGGIIARIGNLVMDGSVKTRLNRLGERLKRAQLN